jgi:hypothetical protein
VELNIADLLEHIGSHVPTFAEAVVAGVLSIIAVNARYGTPASRRDIEQLRQARRERRARKHLGRGR